MYVNGLSVSRSSSFRGRTGNAQQCRRHNGLMRHTAVSLFPVNESCSAGPLYLRHRQLHLKRPWLPWRGTCSKKADSAARCRRERLRAGASDRAVWRVAPLRDDAFKAKLHQSDLFLRFQLRFVRCNKRTNFGRHIQQFEPLLFVQGDGERLIVHVSASIPGPVAQLPGSAQGSFSARPHLAIPEPRVSASALPGSERCGLPIS